MSRIGKQPVPVPSGVKVELSGKTIRTEGPKGELSLDVHPLIDVEIVDEGKTVVCRRQGEARIDRSLHGLTRNLIRNMVQGVADGFEKKLEIIGVGYGAEVQGNKSIKLTVGFANPVTLPIPAGVAVNVASSTANVTTVVVNGPDKQAVGQFAANVRAVRPPEPYKGTGIKYEDEQIRRKAGKAFGS